MKHRYLVVDTREVEAETAAQVFGVVRRTVLEESGEFGLGRANPQVRFYDKRARLAVVRVSRESAPQFPRAQLRVLTTHGSIRSCRPRAMRFLRERYGPLGDDASLDAGLAELARASN